MGGRVSTDCAPTIDDIYYYYRIPPDFRGGVYLFSYTAIRNVVLLIP